MKKLQCKSVRECECRACEENKRERAAKDERRKTQVARQERLLTIDYRLVVLLILGLVELGKWERKMATHLSHPSQSKLASLNSLGQVKDGKGSLGEEQLLLSIKQLDLLHIKVGSISGHRFPLLSLSPCANIC